MTDEQKHGHQYPAEGSAKISGYPACSVAEQGTAGCLATGDPVQGVLAHGVLGNLGTCALQPVPEPVSASRPSLALQPSAEAAFYRWQVSVRKER